MRIYSMSCVEGFDKLQDFTHYFQKYNHKVRIEKYEQFKQQ